MTEQEQRYVKHVFKDWGDAVRYIDDLESRAAAWERLATEARDDYAYHSLRCPAQQGWQLPGPCSCGFDSWLARYAALKAEGESR